MLESLKTLVVQGNMDYSLLAISTFSWVDILTIFLEIRSSWKVIYFLCYVLIFIFAGIYGLQWKYGYSLFIGIYMNTLMQVKHWRRYMAKEFFGHLKVVERCIITCYFVIIWLQKSQRFNIQRECTEGRN